MKLASFRPFGIEYCEGRPRFVEKLYTPAVLPEVLITSYIKQKGCIKLNWREEW